MQLMSLQLSELPKDCTLTIRITELVSIVLVHGLFGDPQKTWTAASSAGVAASSPPTSSEVEPSGQNATTRQRRRDLLAFWRRGNSNRSAVASPSQQTSMGEGVFWPKELLPKVVPQTRIFTWGYDVDINHLFSSASQATVFQHAGTLLSDLANKRTSNVEKRRPLIFIAHSLGGIVVKDVRMSSIKRAPCYRLTVFLDAQCIEE